MLVPVWDGCRRADQGWLERTRIPLFAWSAAARGFFAGRPDDDEEIRRSWLSPANLARRRNAITAGERLGVSAATVALAWVLRRPFPTFAVVGPRTPADLAEALAAVDLEVEALEAL
jgi:aryl-alcohol dehydrogenase-like predicted oxidoreductase